MVSTVVEAIGRKETRNPGLETQDASSKKHGGEDKVS